MLISATGPKLRSDGDIWTIINDKNRVKKRPSKSLQLENIEYFLNNLPSHLRRINRFKRHNNGLSDDQQPFGYNIEILWSPNRYDDIIEKIDVEKSYPFLKFL